MESISSKGRAMFLSTSVFDDITNDKSIQNLCESINSVVPSQFTCLSDCGLFSGGLSTITSSVESILAGVQSFKSEITAHEDNIVAEENYLNNRFSNMKDISVTDSLTYTSIDNSSLNNKATTNAFVGAGALSSTFVNSNIGQSVATESGIASTEKTPEVSSNDIINGKATYKKFAEGSNKVALENGFEPKSEEEITKLYQEYRASTTPTSSNNINTY